MIFGGAVGDEESRSALKMLVPKAPWSAVAPATAVRSNSRAAASLPHSMTLYAGGAYVPTFSVGMYAPR